MSRFKVPNGAIAISTRFRRDFGFRAEANLASTADMRRNASFKQLHKAISCNNPEIVTTPQRGRPF
ncbi:hypothetical protein MPL3365_130523 [Mesorhizobium plurifarium]|uniref:Uncharacterized protein n=1 Tax=Mesorhizobium plurifarium TaxID=69974 RepID=A0A090G3F3_MESPL|nr:hypothetical protein MPL3365_130523 [Mesorhizobium plurifarium]